MCSAAAYYLALGDYARALKSLPAVRTSGATTAGEANLRGVTELMSGRAERALELFDAALAADSHLAAARFNRGITLLRLKRYGEAVGALRSIAEQKTSVLQAPAAYHLALALDQSGDFVAAEKWLAQALAADPDLDSALLYLGSVREKQQNFRGAGEAYREYLRRHPESVVAMLRFGVSAHRAGYRDTARKYLQQVLDLAPASAEAAEARKLLVLWD